MRYSYQQIQATVLRILEPATLGDRTSRIWDISLFILVVLNLVAVALESVPALQNNFGVWLYNFELFSVVIFSLEYFRCGISIIISTFNREGYTCIITCTFNGYFSIPTSHTGNSIFNKGSV